MILTPQSRSKVGLAIRRKEEVMATIKAPSLTIQKRFFNFAPYKELWHEFEAFEGEHLVGRIVCFEAPRGSGDYWLHDLWVDQGHRRSGVGSELLRTAIKIGSNWEYLRMLGELRAYDGVPQKTLEAFFRRHGFSIEERWGRTGKTVVLLMLT